METTKLRRIFKIDDNEIIDPNPDHSLARSKLFLSNTHPELLNAEFGAPKQIGDALVYEVEKRVGSKG